MITYIVDAPNIANKPFVEAHVEKYFDEVKSLLPELPDDIYIWLDNDYLIPETGEGGYSYGPETISIAFDTEFKDKTIQLAHLRETIFHEAYHLTQGHTREKPKVIYKTALDPSIYEGCATVFEREYAGSTPLWGRYAQHTISTLKQWQHLLMEIPSDEYYGDRTVYNKWAFYDSDTDERWRVYKVGTWIVDEALKKSGLDILDLRLKSADDILKLAQS